MTNEHWSWLSKGTAGLTSFVQEKPVEVMNQHFTNFYNAYTSNSSPNVNNYYMKSEKFEIDQYCTLFPIPSQEIRSNPKLTQNYGAR